MSEEVLNESAAAVSAETETSEVVSNADEVAMFEEAVRSVEGKESNSFPKPEAEGKEGDEDSPGEKNETENGGGENFSGDNSSWLDDILGADKDNKGEGDANKVDSPDNKKDEAPAEDTKPAETESIDTLVKRVLELAKEDSVLKSQLEVFSDDMEAFARMAYLVGKELAGNNTPKADTKGIEELETRLKALEEQRVEFEKEDRVKRAEAWDTEMTKRVPDWRDIINKDARFPAWYEKQSETIKSFFNKPATPDDVAYALEKYKSDVGIASQRMSNKRSVYSNPNNDRKITKQNDSGDMSEADEFKAAVEYVKKNR